MVLKSKSSLCNIISDWTSNLNPVSLFNIISDWTSNLNSPFVTSFLIGRQLLIQFLFLTSFLIGRQGVYINIKYQNYKKINAVKVWVTCNGLISSFTTYPFLTDILSSVMVSKTYLIVLEDTENQARIDTFMIKITFVT